MKRKNPSKLADINTLLRKKNFHAHQRRRIFQVIKGRNVTIVGRILLLYFAAFTFRFFKSLNEFPYLEKRFGKSLLITRSVCVIVHVLRAQRNFDHECKFKTPKTDRCGVFGKTHVEAPRVSKSMRDGLTSKALVLMRGAGSEEEC